MDKKEKIIGICALLVLIIAIIISIAVDRSKDEYYITDNDRLYELAVEYLTNADYQHNPDAEKNYYHFFISYDGLGTTQEGKQKHAYMWVLGEGYYLEKGQPKSASGYSMFYKFNFEDEKIISVENPEDGSFYTDSVRKLAKDKKMADKILNYELKMNNDSKVAEYYGKILDPSKLEKKDIKDDNGLLFNITWGKAKCTPVSLNVYTDGKYELYTAYEAIKPNEVGNAILKYTTKEVGNYDYDVINIIKNSKNADKMTFTNKNLPEYEIYFGKNEYVYMMITDSNNKALKEFLTSINVDLHTCATPEYVD